ncbi:aldehyde dehydrogenase family protein [Pseudomaricurvus alkylphenolicus]|uniref:aldehyde dehydrogenase family protein n=1 Tax=Pseudomaricurvus alkylphenolicus TaxID=1306991 RepID=UPI0014211630|nr:aldehyde dehydrogenase family protein [Pseudomaricurvus alkylphenolicus]NIB38192.1 aldehyde dehydrogenase family protein [Pseudomaricurvus alkylphenolicus]
MEYFRLLIGGELVEGDRHSDVINPSTEQVIASCPRASEEQLDQAVDSALAAFKMWSEKSIDERAQALNAIADALQSNVEGLAHLLTEEQGKPLSDATREVQITAAFFRFYAAKRLTVELLEDSEDRRVERHRVPLGVIGAIVPWNFPLATMVFKIAPALIAGNTVVLKPAPTTPLTTLKFAQLTQDILPPGVLNVIADDNELGHLLVGHRDVRKVSFTGSIPTGSKVMATAAAQIKRITLELGGNDAAIVLGDVIPEDIVPKLFHAAFNNNGQICAAIKRLFVHESIYDDVCKQLEQLAESAIVGDGFDPNTQFGPLQNKRQYDLVKSLIDAARHDGNVICGGAMEDQPGFFIRPTLVRDVSPGSRVVDEEQFGPVLPIIKFSDVQEAIKQANASSNGLGGSIWSSDIAAASALAVKMESGTVWVNKHTEILPHIPFGGAKMSGLGCELGDDGLFEYTQSKIINVAL